MVNIKKSKKSVDIVSAIYYEYLDIPEDNSFHQVDDIFLGNVNGKWIAYDRICDHNSGPLTLCKNNSQAICRMHDWVLELATGKYVNGCKKSSLKVEVVNGQLRIERKVLKFPELDVGDISTKQVEFYFNAHASYTIKVGNLSITTDPWLIGSCFATGWWHAAPPSLEAIERLRNSDVIYISHNHPDHLHLETLKAHTRPGQILLVPKFKSCSVERILLNEGFNNIVTVDFLHDVLISKNSDALRVNIIKSGDDRDDSSLILWTANCKALFGVDTNKPNNFVLPKVDILFTSFAEGATGFPCMIENYSSAQRDEIISKKRRVILHNYVDKLIRSCMPSYVVPYAGYFTEVGRDSYLNKVNLKNSPDQLISFIRNRHKDITCVNPLTHDLIKFSENNVLITNFGGTAAFFVDSEYINKKIIEYTAGAKVVDKAYLERLGKIFCDSGFGDHIIVVIVPTDDDFNSIGEHTLVIDFSADRASYEVIKSAGFDNKSMVDRIRATGFNGNVEILKVRADSLSATLMRGLPFEDLSIGFQAKMYREPNVYNFKFWDFFTNNYLIKLE